MGPLYVEIKSNTAFGLLFFAVILDLIRDPGHLKLNRPWIPDLALLVRNDDLSPG